MRRAILIEKEARRLLPMLGGGGPGGADVMGKKFFAMVLLVGVLCAASAFAGMTESNLELGKGNAIKSIPRLIAFLSGAIPGGIIMVKFMFDMVKAYGNREQNPQGIQKAVVNFLIVVGVLLCYVVVVNALFSDDASTKASGTDTTGTPTQQAGKTGNTVYVGLSGAEVSLDWLAEHGIEAPAEDDVLWAEGGAE